MHIIKFKYKFLSFQSSRRGDYYGRHGSIFSHKIKKVNFRVHWTEFIYIHWTPFIVVNNHSVSLASTALRIFKKHYSLKFIVPTYDYFLFSFPGIYFYPRTQALFPEISYYQASSGVFFPQVQIAIERNHLLMLQRYLSCIG